MNNVDMAIKELARDQAQQMYMENPELFTRQVKEYMGDIKGKLSDMSEDDVKRKAEERVIRDIRIGIEKKMKHNVKMNMGLRGSFDINSYSIEAIKEFLVFYHEKVLESEEVLLRNDEEIGELKPNKWIANYARSYKLKHNFEKYYDYILLYRNNMVKEEKDIVETFEESRRCIGKTLGTVLGNVDIIGSFYWTAKEVWEIGLANLKDAVQKNIDAIMVIAQNGWSVNYYMAYSMGRILEEGLLGLINYVIKYSNTERRYVETIKMSLKKAIGEIERLVWKEDNEFWRDCETDDIFQNYAIAYYLDAVQTEIEIIYNILCELYNLTLADDREPFDKAILKTKDSSILKDYIWGDQVEGKDKTRRDTKILRAAEIGQKLNNIMGVNIDCRDQINIKSIIDEIFFYDSEIRIMINGKKRNYKMKSLANNLLKDRYNRDEEVIILNEKIKRGIACNTYGKDIYLLENELYRGVYNIEKEILSKRYTEKNYIFKQMIYWRVVIGYLLDEAEKIRV